MQTQKLASLAQLTAGIAHEIKNPLNFVNNFSGISVELIDELEETLENVKAMRHALQSLNSRIPCGAISIRSFSTASVQIPSSRTCCCTRARVQGSTGLSISMPSSMKRSILPITERARRGRVSISPWKSPLTRLPVK